MAEKRVAILKRANKLFRQGKADAAVKEYKKILEIKPDDLEVRRIVGDLELRQNNIKEAIEQFDWIADYYLKEGFFAKAIAMYKRITRVEPDSEIALFKLADLYTKQGLVMEAKQIYLDIAEECKRKNNQKKALDMYKKILEFDRSNIKMRLLLADNYLKEGLESEALNEYLTAADIIINKKDYRRAEELLANVLNKAKDVRIIEKLINIYIKEGEDDKAIKLLNEQGLDVFENIEMLKVLGELYLKKNMMGEAEKIFSKIASLNPEETEVIMRLGKVYIQREDYDKAFKLFLPIINKNIQNNKFEEASNLLRFIIASNNSYIPALLKLSEIFKIGGKTNNLIALYESMVPIYEQKGMIEELKGILEELIQLSDTPFTYEEQLAKLTGQVAREEEAAEEEKENEREKEFISYNLRVAEEALKVSDIGKAIDVLKKSKITFPKNVAVRKRLFEIYLEGEQIELAVEEGKGLLELYKFLNEDDGYADLLEKLSTLKPEDEKLVALSGEEKTSIEIDFDKDELEEQIQEIGDPDLHEEEIDDGDMGDDVLVLSEEENLQEVPLLEGEEVTKSLSSVLSEVDFYVNDGYFGDAEKLIDQLKQKYPGNKQLLAKIEKLEKAKREGVAKDDSASTGMGLNFEIERAEPEAMEIDVEGEGDQRRESTERIDSHDHEDLELIHNGGDSNIEININVDENGSSSPGIKLSDEELAESGNSDNLPLNLDIDVDSEPEPPLGEPESESDSKIELEPEFNIQEESQDQEPVLELDQELGFDSQMEFEPELELPVDKENSGQEMPQEPPESQKSSPPPPKSSPPEEPEAISEPELDLEPAEGGEEVFELDSSMSEENIILPTVPEMPVPDPISQEEAAESEVDVSDENLFEIESSIAEESSSAQEFEDSKVGLRIDDDLLKPSSKINENSSQKSESEDEKLDLKVDLEEPENTDDIPIMAIDEDLLVQSPSASKEKAPTFEEHSSSAIEELDLDLDSIMVTKDEDSVYDLDSPFQEVEAPDVPFESEEDLLKDEIPFLDEPFLEIENNVRDELEAINNWLKELEKQRTSTIEKNMMEIFEEFKKGVDEKIGQEDFDTRYNLGIAYKEMGLLEEAIHEFLISAKHPSKFFDSAGLLGMSFREKGMFGEAITWFEKALVTPDRRKEEYLAIKYELVLTLKLKEDYKQALKITVEILKEDQNYRDVKALYQELRSHFTAS